MQEAYNSKLPGQTQRSAPTLDRAQCIAPLHNSQLSTLNLLFALALSLATCYSLLATPLWAQEAKSPVKILVLHAHRYQDFQRDRHQCEVFGEIQNLSNRPLKRVTVTIEFLDEKGKLVATEEAVLVLRVIAPGNARGEVRSVRPQEIGHFIQDTTQCPEQWLEGRIRYKIKNLEWE